MTRAVGMAVCGWFVMNQAQAQRLPNSEAFLSPRAKTLLKEPWSSNSFARGIVILADTNEAPFSRAAALEVLHENRRKLAPDEMRSLLGAAAQLAKGGRLDETNTAFALSVMANLALTMRDQGQLSESESKQDAGFFITTATDARHHLQVRASAISALGILGISEARNPLRNILTNTGSATIPELVRPACLSLLRIEGERAVPDLAGVLQRTSDPGVFGTAAFALGQLKKRECLVALVENLHRFPDSGACGAALVGMDGVISGILKNPADENLTSAIEATGHLWREGQREACTPLLRNLLSSAPLNARKMAAERLLDGASRLDFESEKRELALVSEAIGDQIELQEYQLRIRHRLLASLVTPNTSSTDLPPSAIK